MANNIQNNGSAWKISLDALDSLPDEPSLLKEKNWQKLWERLAKTRPQRSAYPLWIAACLLGIMFFPWVLHDNKRVPVAAAKQYRISTDKEILNTKNEMLNAKKEILNTKIKNTLEPANRKPDELLAADNNRSLPEIKEDPLPLKSISLDTATSGTRVEKKKLLVVHINELLAPAQNNNPFRRLIKRQGTDITQQHYPDEPISREHILVKNIN